MHIPGQRFGRVRIKTDRDSRIRFANWLQGQFFKKESQKKREQLKITIVNLPFVQHATLCVSFRVRPNTTYNLYTSFKYYGRDKIRV